MSSESAGGLKRRNVQQAVDTLSTSGGASKHLNSDGFANDGEHVNENDSHDENNDEYDADSKTTRLTLMEEILLLGLKDKEVLF
jgi:hypothetical protein